MPENKEIKESLEKTIDTLFSDTPGAPVSSKKPVKAPVPKAPAAPEAPKAEPAVIKTEPAPKETAVKAEAPKAQSTKAAPKAESTKAATKAESAPKTEGAKNALTVSELKKLIAQRPEPKPVEKTPVWSIITVVCSMILALSAAGIAVVAAYFYFGPGSEAAVGKPVLGYLSMVMCIVVCAIFVGYSVGTAFMLRKIEKDLREIKSRL